MLLMRYSATNKQLHGVDLTSDRLPDFWVLFQVPTIPHWHHQSLIKNALHATRFVVKKSLFSLSRARQSVNVLCQSW